MYLALLGRLLILRALRLGFSVVIVLVGHFLVLVLKLLLAS
jgi:hypothetical protein